MKKYNLDTLVCVTIYDYTESIWYEYRPEHKRLWHTTKEHIVYEPTGMNLGMDVPTNHKLIDGVLYENPHVILDYVNNTYQTYYFDTVYDATKFRNEITDCGRWI